MNIKDPYANPEGDVAQGVTQLYLGTGTLFARRFRLERLIGEGGMAAVYAAIDLARMGDPEKAEVYAVPADEVPSRAWVALKFLSKTINADLPARDALINELDRARDLPHPHIVRVYEWYEDSGQLAYSMELLAGHALHVELAAHPDGLGLARTLELLGPIADALAFAHGRGIVHRDVSAKNIFLAGKANVGGATVKLIDFGISHVLNDTHTTHSSAAEAATRSAGNAPYMSPERMGGARADARDDVYGLAVVAYQCLTGNLPFQGPALFQRPAEFTPQRPQGLTDPAWRHLLKGLAYQRDARETDPVTLVDGLGAEEESRVSWKKYAVLAGVMTALVLVAVLLWPEREHVPPVGAASAANGVGGTQKPIAAEAAPTEDGAAELEKQRQALEAQRQAQEAERARLAKLAEETEAKRRAQEDAGKRLAEQNAEAERKVREAEAERTRLEQARAEAEQRKREAQARRERDDGAWTKAKSANTRESYATYLTGCGADGCGHEAEARRAQAALPVKYTLTVRSNVDGDRVYVDGEAKGSTRLELALEGGRSYRVRVEKDGYEAWEETVGLDGATTVWAELKPKEVPRQAYEPEMVDIPGGRYQMGCVSGKECGGDEKPVHWEEVKGFRMGKYEVTNGEYRKYKPEHDSGEWKGSSLNGDDQPVVNVSWDDAMGYAKWLSGKTGKAYRLPTEAEWEYAARGGTETSRYWGNEDEGQCRNANGADASAKRKHNWSWTVASCDDGYAETAPVGRYKANRYGLYDMLGNVREWTCSAYDKEGYKQGKDGAHTQCGETAPDGRALRGGSWGNLPRGLRSATRFYGTADYRFNFVGFRLAQDP